MLKQVRGTDREPVKAVNDVDKQRSFDVWLAVKLTVEVIADDTDDLPWIGDAVAKGADWLTELVHDAASITPGIAVTRDPVDLTDVAVRVLNQFGEDRRSGVLPEGVPRPDP